MSVFKVGGALNKTRVCLYVSYIIITRFRLHLLHANVHPKLNPTKRGLRESFFACGPKRIRTGAWWATVMNSKSSWL